jgi:DNA polymerase III delta' subunit
MIPMTALLHPRTQAQLDAIAQARKGSYIFHGLRSVGKATAAYELARRLNCQGDDPALCAACRQYAAGTYPDLITLRPEDKPSITIEQVRQLTSALSLSLYVATGVRVVIIDEAHTLTTEAQNALLKLIEEPPPQTIFILIADHAEALLPTVRSRCTPVYFPRLAADTIAAWLPQRHNIKPSLAAELAAASNGAPGVAVTLATRPDEAEARLNLHRAAVTAPARSMFERLLLAGRLASDKADLAQFGQALHSALISQVQNGITPADVANHQLAALEQYRRQLQAKVAPRVALERLMLEL